MKTDISPILYRSRAYTRMQLMSAALGVDMPRFRIRGSKYRPHVGAKQLAKLAKKGAK